MSQLPVKAGCVLTAAVALTLLLLYAQALAITPDRELEFRADWLNLELPSDRPMDCVDAERLMRTLESDVFRGCKVNEDCRVAGGPRFWPSAIAVDVEEEYFRLFETWRQVMLRFSCTRSIACGRGPVEARCKEGLCRVESLPILHARSLESLPQPERWPLSER